MTTSSERRLINGEWIKALRKGLGLSQEELAGELEVSRLAVIRWEGEAFRPSRLAAKALLEFAEKHRDQGVSVKEQGSSLARLKRRQTKRSQRRSDHDSAQRNSAKRAA
jgi:transcriptional regulator with XRE-family HTH domain